MNTDNLFYEHVTAKRLKEFNEYFRNNGNREALARARKHGKNGKRFVSFAVQNFRAFLRHFVLQALRDYRDFCC